MRKIFAAMCVLAVSGCPADPTFAHDWYTGKLTQHPNHKGWSCCNMDENKPDCKPVRAWKTPDGNWQFIFPDDGRTYDVPDYAMHPAEENPEPFQASACVWYEQVLCFWPKQAGG